MRAVHLPEFTSNLFVDDISLQPQDKVRSSCDVEGAPANATDESIDEIVKHNLIGAAGQPYRKVGRLPYTCRLWRLQPVVNAKLQAERLQIVVGSAGGNCITFSV